MSEFSLFIRNQAKEAERKLKVQCNPRYPVHVYMICVPHFLFCGHQRCVRNMTLSESPYNESRLLLRWYLYTFGVQFHFCPHCNLPVCVYFASQPPGCVRRN
jgi:hypothetical protein